MNRTAGVDSIVAEWLAQRERGEAPAASELIRSHPDVADELRLRLHALRVVDDLFAADPREASLRMCRGVCREACIAGRTPTARPVAMATNAIAPSARPSTRAS